MVVLYSLTIQNGRQDLAKDIISTVNLSASLDIATNPHKERTHSF